MKPTPVQVKASSQLTSELISHAIIEYGSVRAYSQKTAQSESTFRRRIKQPETLTLEEIRELRKALNFDKEKLCALVSAMI